LAGAKAKAALIAVGDASVYHVFRSEMRIVPE
jgi:hypothetical protein